MIITRKLQNNITLIYEKLPHVRSVSIGCWFKAGSINEDSSNRGIAHVIEHMLFKGTKNRSAKDIAEELDNIGGHLNAFTSKELTCFYTRTLENHLDVAIDVLGDMIINSTFEEKMLKREKQVVLEEIAMYNDSPEDVVHEKLEENVWKNHPISYPISGYKETVETLNRKQISDFMGKYYQPDNMVISVAGNFDEAQLIKLLEKTFVDFVGSSKIVTIDDPVFHTCDIVNHKDVEQTYLSMAFNAYGYDDDRRFALLAASNIFGGGMSSKLFQHVREEKGLVYTIGSTIQAYKNNGMLNVFAGMNKKHLDEVLSCIEIDMTEMRDNNITDAELHKAKQQLKSGLIMGLESTTARMNSNARTMLLRNKLFDQDDLMKKIDAITQKDVAQVTTDIFNYENQAISIVTSK